MGVDRKTLIALQRAIGALRDEPAHPLPTGTLEALADLAQPGTDLRIDLAASREIGAPLVSVVQTAPGPDLSALTPRQREVAGLILDGRSNAQIADALGISLATVKDHVHALLGRLGLPSRMALIAAARGVAKP